MNKNDIKLEDNFKDCIDISKEDSWKKYSILKRLPPLKITTMDLDSSKTMHIHRFNNRSLRTNSKEEKNILSIISYADSNKINIETGNFVGVIFHKGFKIEIISRFGELFLLRMLNFLNDIYIDTCDFEEFKKEKSVKESNHFDFIISYLFLQSLEKALIMGLPKSYRIKKDNSYKLRGNIDINSYIKKNIPFLGKVSSMYRELEEVPEIALIISKALTIVSCNFQKLVNSKIKTFATEIHKFSNYCDLSQDVFSKAKNHKSLISPMFNKYKKVLEYAEIIINNYDCVKQQDTNSKQASGFLFDISELFEIYLEKLLLLNLPNIKISPQSKLNSYEKTFFPSSMYPDLVLKTDDDKVIIFDAKYKRMRGIYPDIDRADFYQIHSYMSYFGKDAILGGLLYPIESENFNFEESSDWFFGQSQRKPVFVIDGINLVNCYTKEDLLLEESNFIKRIEDKINNLNT